MDKDQKFWVLVCLIAGLTTVLTTTAIYTNDMLSNKYFAEHGYSQKVTDRGPGYDPVITWEAQKQ